MYNTEDEMPESYGIVAIKREIIWTFPFFDSKIIFISKVSIWNATNYVWTPPFILTENGCFLFWKVIVTEKVSPLMRLSNPLHLKIYI